MVHTFERNVLRRTAALVVKTRERQRATPGGRAAAARPACLPAQLCGGRHGTAALEPPSPHAQATARGPQKQSARVVRCVALRVRVLPYHTHMQQRGPTCSTTVHCSTQRSALQHSTAPPPSPCSPGLPVVAVVGEVQLGPDEQHAPVQQQHAAVVHHTCRCTSSHGPAATAPRPHGHGHGHGRPPARGEGAGRCNGRRQKRRSLQPGRGLLVERWRAAC